VLVSDPSDRTLDVVPIGNGRYQVTTESTKRTAFAVVARDTWVFLDGRTYVVSSPEASPRRSRADDQAALTAPMPATVLAVNVTPGQRVERNDVVIVLEAMKMELPIRAPRDGIVKTIGCEVGELVQHGTTLLALEEGNEG
jgi:biotin carboxyl carrier protein